jgi:3'-phosphoadenosine 5'-phosphosulfate sulfotransferase (PAPS reductase)/FAD synthetase
MLFTQLELWESPIEQPNLPARIALDRYDRIIIMLSGGKDSIACLLEIRSKLETIGQLEKLECWHHLVDGAEGSNLMDWACTRAYCQALCNWYKIPLYFSWLEGGFERELNRNNTPKGKTWFETPDGLRSAGGNGKPNTRLKFPQLSPNLSVRWCSSYLKIDVAAIALNNQQRFSGTRTLVVTGERAEEGGGRAKYAQFEPHRSNTKGRHIDHWRPVHQWSESKVWKLIAKHRINPHPAYRLGLGRTSCQFCIFNNADHWKSMQQVDPDRIYRLIEYERIFGMTIHRNLSIEQQIDKGTLHKMNEIDIKAALSTRWDEPIILS